MRTIWPENEYEARECMAEAMEALEVSEHAELKSNFLKAFTAGHAEADIDSPGCAGWNRERPKEQAGPLVDVLGELLSGVKQSRHYTEIFAVLGLAASGADVALRAAALANALATEYADYYVGESTDIAAANMPGYGSCWRVPS